MALAGNKPNNHRTANHRETTCSAPPLHILVQNNYSVNVISKQRSARKIPNLNRNRQTQFCTLQWMYILTGWSLALLCSASLVAAAVPIADFEPSLLNVVAAAPEIIEKYPRLVLPVTIIEDERYFEQLINEVARKKTKLSPPYFESHPHGRSLGTDWCTSGKPMTGVHTLPRGSTCTFTSYLTIAVSTSLELSSASGSGEMAIISGGLVTRHFYVPGTRKNTWVQ